MTNEPIAVETALLNLYSATRKANLPLDEHDMCRAYVDVLAQALNLKVDWVVPTTPSDESNKSEPDKQLDKPKRKKGKNV